MTSGIAPEPRPPARRSAPGWLVAAWPWLAILGLGLPYNLFLTTRAVFEIADEGYLYYVAAALHAGARPFVDVELQNYSPGLFRGVGWLLASSPDHGILVVRLVMAAALAAAAACAFAALHPLLGRPGAFAGALLVVLVPGPFYKAYVRLLQLALLAVWARYAGAPRRRYWVAGALLTGVAFWVRPDAVYAGLALALLCTLAHAWRSAAARAWPVLAVRGSAFVAVVALAVLPLLLLLGEGAVIRGYWRQLLRLVGSNAERALSSYNLPPPPLSALGPGSPDTVFAWAFYGSLLVSVLAILCGAVLGRRGLRRAAAAEAAAPDLAGGVVAAWLALNLPQWALARPDVYHLTQQAFAVLVAAAFLASIAWRWWRLAAAPLGRVAGAAGLALVGVAGVALVVGLGVCGPRWSVAAALAPARTQQLESGARYRTPVLDRFDLLLDTITLTSDAADTVLSVPFLPGVNYLLGRRLPTPQVHVLPESVPSAEKRAHLVARLAAAAPAFAVYAHDYTTTGGPAGVLRSWAPELHDYLTRELRPALDVDGRALLVNPHPQPSLGPEPPLRPEATAPALVARARAALESRKMGAATALATRAVRWCGDAPQVMLLVAAVAEERRDLATALGAYDWAVALASRTPPLAADRGRALEPGMLPWLRDAAFRLLPEPQVFSCAAAQEAPSPSSPGSATRAK
ncbi:MAG: hypothetical protein HY903_16650 [Deltaproteobacteria bacterium]|nr:hypothetical protein [Deltaproteobacteria bacterium]